RFFIPDSSLAANLLSGPPQFVPGPSMHQPILALRPPFKRYFDSLAGQSLGKRSAPQFEYIEEKRK
uniref:Histone-lysine N-methyltransferase SETMAR n=1 Tax=Meloidogyne hapla TaxID=6305 RepID=A0A1I8B5T6_MELHA